MYPVFVARVVGHRTAVCTKILRLALGYDHLCAFNLIIAAVDEQEGQTGPEVAVYFFPRRFDGKVRPTDRLPGWSFGAWEMGGVFLTKDQEIYDSATYSLLVDALAETGIQPESRERTAIDNLLAFP
jgi:hypothetical protein